MPGLEASQRADFMTFYLCVPDRVRAATDHLMDWSQGPQSQTRVSGVSSGQLTQQHYHQTPHCPACQGCNIKATILASVLW